MYCRSSKDKCTLVPPCQTVPSTTNPLDVSSQNVMLALPVKEISCLKAIHPALLLHRSKSQLLSPGSRLPSPGSRIWIPPREVEPVMIAVPLLISHQSNSSNLAFYLLCTIVRVPYLLCQCQHSSNHSAFSRLLQSTSCKVEDLHRSLRSQSTKPLCQQLYPNPPSGLGTTVKVFHVFSQYRSFPL